MRTFSTVLGPSRGRKRAELPAPTAGACAIRRGKRRRHAAITMPSTIRAMTYAFAIDPPQPKDVADDNAGIDALTRKRPSGTRRRQHGREARNRGGAEDRVEGCFARERRPGRQRQSGQQPRPGDAHEGRGGHCGRAATRQPHLIEPSVVLHLEQVRGCLG